MKNTAVRLLLVLSCFLLKSFPLFSQNLIIPSQYYKVTETPWATIYCNDEQQTEAAKTEMEYAFNRISQLIGKPGKINLIIAADPIELQRIDFTEFLSRAATFLPFTGVVPSISTINLHPDSPAVEKLSFQGILAHEAGHVYFIEYVDRMILEKAGHNPERVAGKSGHPAIYDWLDEFMAEYCEFPFYRESRKKSLLAKIENKDFLLTVDSLLKLEHPSYKNGIPGMGLAGADQTASMTYTKTTVASPVETLLDAFYLESYAFGQYLISKEGNKIIAVVVEMYIKGKGWNEIKPYLKSVPKEKQALQNDFDGWIKTAFK